MAQHGLCVSGTNVFQAIPRDEEEQWLVLPYEANKLHTTGPLIPAVYFPKTT